MKDIAAQQLAIHASNNKSKSPSRYTTSHGMPVPTRTASLTVGNRGPMLLQDVVFMDELQKFDRERIPERVVHAKGSGAHGYFEVTKDISKYTRAKVFEGVGKKTPIFMRFSTVIGEKGSPDTVRDPRGFAIKFYTEDGIWDLVGNNTPIFFIRDPILFPSFIHSLKRNPVTNLKDANAAWDFVAQRPEALHQYLFLNSDRGLPDGFRHMNGYGSHTFKLVNSQDEAFWCKFHMKPDQGVKNLPVDKARELSIDDPDYAQRDLYNAIENGDYPKWNMFIQVMTIEQSKEVPFNPFDVTKIWPHKEYPLIPVGNLVLNKNPLNYFAEVEQAAFAPSHVVPGIDFSPDKMLQGRVFSYSDTHYHRLGPNYQQIPINCPFKVRNIQRDGPMCVNSNQSGDPNYYPSSFDNVKRVCEKERDAEHHYDLNGKVGRWESGDEDNYSQPRVFWEKVLDEAHRDRVVANIVDSLKMAAPQIQEKCVKEFSKVHPDFGNSVRHSLCQEMSKLKDDSIQEPSRMCSPQ